jgi:outer membrane protein OmpA-like peptidoglycan-associated protein
MKPRFSTWWKNLIAIGSALSLQPAWSVNARPDLIVVPYEPLSFLVEDISPAISPLNLTASPLSFPIGLDMTETQSTIEVTLAADVLFDFDKADIRVVGEPTLHELAQLIRDKARGVIGIQGFTDGLGGDAYNQRLSERRAVSVKAWLVANEKLEAPRLMAAGFGARNPVAPNRHANGSDDPEGRQRNRRVTVIIRK